MKKNIDLREEMILVFDDLRAGRIEKSQAKELSNVIGKILTSAKYEYEYNKMLGKKVTIDFFEK
jgi:2,3-bisphosphoglycerate-independent phosphoglycerate mutase